MLANFFEKTKPINSIVIAIAFFCYAFLYFFLEESPSFSLVSSFSSILLNLLFLFSIGTIVIKYGISKNNLFVPFFIVLLYGVFPKTFQVDKSFYTVFLFVILYRRISKLEEPLSFFSKLFDCGFIVGIAFLIHNWCVLYLLLVYISLFLRGKAMIRHIIIPLVGLSVPIFLFFTYMFFTDSITLFWERFQFEIPQDFYVFESLRIAYSLGVIFILIFVAIVSIFPKVISVSNHFRYHYIVNLCSLLIAVFLFLFSKNTNGTHFLYGFVPIAILFAQLMEFLNRKWVKDILIISFILFSIGSLCISSFDMF